MKKTLIACRTIENELNKVLEKRKEAFEIRWLEAGLHDVPQKLNARLQQEIDACTGCDAALLLMGTCGNSIVGIKSNDIQLVIPRVDDCISFLMGSQSKRKNHKNTYFMTGGWLKGERNIMKEYEYCIQKYGAETGNVIFDMMFRNYEYLALLDTGAFDTEKAQEETLHICDTLKFKYKKIDGTLSYIEEMLDEKWSSERYIIIPPGHTVTMEDCRLK